jgi:hypothetical protein
LEDQAPLAAWRVSDLERRLRSDGTLPAASPLRLALLSQSYPGIATFAERARAALRLNGGKTVDEDAGNFLEIQTPEPTITAFRPQDVAQSIAAFAPQVIVIGVDSDFTTFYLRMIEDAWPAGAARAQYVVTSMNQQLGLLAPIVGEDDALAGRISGTQPFLDPDVANNLSSFEARFLRRYQQEADNTQVGYDAFYAAAYALVTADSQQRFDGSAIAAGLQRLTAGPAVDVTPSAAQIAIAYLLGQGSIELVGTSSRFDWSGASREITSDVGMWCLTRAKGGALAIETGVGPRWAHTTDQVSGAYNCP